MRPFVGTIMFFCTILLQSVCELPQIMSVALGVKISKKKRWSVVANRTGGN